MFIGIQVTLSTTVIIQGTCLPGQTAISVTDQQTGGSFKEFAPPAKALHMHTNIHLAWRGNL
jgi:hypothetical protein